MDANPQLCLSEFCFSYRAQQAIDPSLLSPSLWHGIFGHALRQRVCLVPESPECKGCMFIQQCDYPFLFEGIKPLNAKGDKTSPDIPAPHIFKTVTEQIPLAVNQQQINISVILVGKATQRLTVLINAMDLAGSNGIGKARTPLQLERVTQVSQSLSQLILENDDLYKALPAQTLLIPEIPASVQLIFKTPYRSNKTQFDGAFFLMQLIRRTSSLQDFYTSTPLEADFKQLKALTEKAKINKAVYKQQDSRYSARHQQKIDTSGFMGKLTINMSGIEALWPYIYLGQWLHVGKNASFGYGRYELLRLK